MKKKLFVFVLIVVLAATIATPALAAENVYDTAEILSSGEVTELSYLASEKLQEDRCGIYIFTAPRSDGDVYDVSTGLYVDYDLGYGDTKDGVMLYLSMEEREYSLVTFGEYANSVFSNYVLDDISEQFLDDFARDNWYEGFVDYVTACQEHLVSGPAAEPPSDYQYNSGDQYYEYTHRGPAPGAVAAVIIIPIAAALIFCFIMKRKMNTARKKTEARQYICENGVDIRVRQDIFTHATRHVQNINSGSGGGGGFSGKSGRF